MCVKLIYIAVTHGQYQYNNKPYTSMVTGTRPPCHEIQSEKPTRVRIGGEINQIDDNVSMTVEKHMN